MGTRKSWLDPDSGSPVIDQKARALEAFVAAMADGVVDSDEITAQEGRVAALMRDIEPQLDDALHGKVTALLCEMAALDIMNTLHSLQSARKTVTFRG